MRSFLLSLGLACVEVPVSTVSAPAEQGPAEAPTYEGRISAALARSHSVTLDAATLKLIGQRPLLADAPDRYKGTDGLKLSRWDAAADALLTDADEAPAADLLLKSAPWLLVLSEVRPSVDRDSKVLSRVYHHDALGRFQLVYVGRGYLLYRIRPDSVSFPPEIAAGAISWIRETLAGRSPAPFPPLTTSEGEWNLITTIRGQGQELAISLSEGKTLDRALYEAAEDLETAHRRYRETTGFPRISEHIADLRIEIHRIIERAPIAPDARSDEELKSLWELGIDGAILLDRKGKKKQSGSWPGSVAATRGINNPDSYLRALAREFRWDSIRPWREPEIELAIIRDVHYVETPGVQRDGRNDVAPAWRGSLPVPPSMVTLEHVKQSIILSGEWYLSNLQHDGSVTYKYWPEDNRYSDEYNHVRHELATWNLWQSWTLDPRPEFLDGAVKAQDWTLRALVDRKGNDFAAWELEDIAKSPMKDELLKEGMAYLDYGNNSKLGSVVVGLFGMIEVARAQNDHSKDELMRDFGRFVLFMQDPDGRYRGYHVPKSHSYRDQTNDIVPGEAALSLVYLYEWFNDERYLEPLDRFFSYYSPWFRERAAKRRPNGVWPSHIYENDTRLELVQFGPWTVMAANAFTRVRPDRKDVAEFGLEVARWMVESYQYRRDRAPWPDYLGGYYKFEGELPAMQAFCYAEGTAAAYDMALRMAPDQAAYFGTATLDAVRFGLVMQHDTFDTRFFARPEQVVGGTKYALNEPKVRIDYTYHAQSALYQWLKAAEKDPNLAETIKAMPDEATRARFALMGYPGYRSGGPLKAGPIPEGAMPKSNPPLDPPEAAGDGE